VGTICPAHIIVNMHSREYNVYFRAIGQRLTAMDPKGALGQAVFRSSVFGGGHYLPRSYYC
jgi:hypothetical protein